MVTVAGEQRNSSKKEHSNISLTHYFSTQGTTVRLLEVPAVSSLA